MYRLTAIAVVFLILIIGKILFKDNNPNLAAGMKPKPVAAEKIIDQECLSIEENTIEHSGATGEDPVLSEKCGKDTETK